MRTLVDPMNVIVKDVSNFVVVPQPVLNEYGVTAAIVVWKITEGFSAHAEVKR
jgi:hypothetical protein